MKYVLLSLFVIPSAFASGQTIYPNNSIKIEDCKPEKATHNNEGHFKVLNTQFTGEKASEEATSHGATAIWDKFNRTVALEKTTELSKKYTSEEYASGCYTYRIATLELYCSMVAGDRSSGQCAQFCTLRTSSDDCR